VHFVARQAATFNSKRMFLANRQPNRPRQRQFKTSGQIWNLPVQEDFAPTSFCAEHTAAALPMSSEVHPRLHVCGFETYGLPEGNSLARWRLGQQGFHRKSLTDSGPARVPLPFVLLRRALKKDRRSVARLISAGFGFWLWGSILPPFTDFQLNLGSPDIAGDDCKFALEFREPRMNKPLPAGSLLWSVKSHCD